MSPLRSAAGEGSPVSAPERRFPDDRHRHQPLGAPLPPYLSAVSDVFPALALGVGQSDPATMSRSPSDADEAIITRRGWSSIARYGPLIAASVLAAFTVALGPLGLPTSEAVTVSFLALVLARLWHVVNMRRAGTSPWRNQITRNPPKGAALGLSTALVGGTVYVPRLHGVLLGLAPPGAAGSARALACAAGLVPLFGGQLVLHWRER